MNQVAPESARRAIDVAALLGVFHSAATVYWACGGTWLISTLGARILDSFSGRLWLLWPGALVKLAVALAPALLVRCRWPAPRLLHYGMWAVATVLVCWGGANTMIGNLVLAGAIRPAEGYDRAAMIGHAWLWDPIFLMWGLALGIALSCRRLQSPGLVTPPPAVTSDG